MNFPNLISLFRLIVLIPLIAYFFLIGENYIGLGLCVLFEILDGIDGWLARKLNQITETGTVLDVSIDTTLMVMLLMIFYYLGYINLPVIALVGAHRLTRLFLNAYFKFKTKTYYNPVALKTTGVVPLIYIFLIPLVIKYFGKSTTDIITLAVMWGTYMILLISAIVAIIHLTKSNKYIK